MSHNVFTFTQFCCFAVRVASLAVVDMAELDMVAVVLRNQSLAVVLRIQTLAVVLRIQDLAVVVALGNRVVVVRVLALETNDTTTVYINNYDLW